MPAVVTATIAAVCAQQQRLTASPQQASEERSRQGAAACRHSSRGTIHQTQLPERLPGCNCRNTRQTSTTSVRTSQARKKTNRPNHLQGNCAQYFPFSSHSAHHDVVLGGLRPLVYAARQRPQAHEYHETDPNNWRSEKRTYILRTTETRVSAAVVARMCKLCTYVIYVNTRVFFVIFSKNTSAV